ncbi:PspC domain-containing protein [Microbacterium sp. gxy059]|uniref:PspC domain-containing protein n=1 Tax=Microbacterium sp. gxy059 TaxID=2957199 RepID=UPI003D98195C
MNDLIRPRRGEGRVIAGVCAAVARRFGWSPTLVRIVTILALAFAGLPLWVYIVLWILIPAQR